MTEPREAPPAEAGDPPAKPQAVTTPLSVAAIFLVVTVDEGGEQAVVDLMPQVSALRKAIAFRRPEAGLHAVLGIGAGLWPRLFDAAPPAELHPFAELDGDRHHAPSTPGDLLLHIQASSHGVCFELANQLMTRLRGAVTTVEDIHGFAYFDRRNLLGFVDGTENPEGADADDAVYIDGAAADGDHSAGTYAIVQKYLHDMDAWHAISIDEQQRVVGRTKLDDIELDDDVQPSNSHVALTDIDDDDGNELDIYRANMPFGSAGAGEIGTYFIGYAKRADTLERMLRNMFVGDPPGNYDRLLDFSTPQTGTLFFVPSQTFLDDPPGTGGDEADSASEAAANDAAVRSAGRATTDTTTDTDGSLGIGSLNEEH